MVRLEYRLLDELHGFPVLYYYQKISREEVSMRFACDYFVKEHTVYERTSNAIDRGTYVIYIKEAVDEQVLSMQEAKADRTSDDKTITVEVRHYQEDTSVYPVIHTFTFRDERDVLLHVQNQYFYLNDKEWERTSTEIDEDREVFVIYVQPSQEKREGGNPYGKL